MAGPKVRSGLRLRIAATIAGIVLVAVAGLGVAVHFLVVANRVSEARAAADERLHAALEIYRSNGLLSFDAHVDEPALPAELRASIARNGDRGTLVRGDSVRTVWAAGRTGDVVLSTVMRFPAVDSSVRAVDRALLAAGAVTVLVATLAGLLSANQLARRLRIAARTARELAGGGDPASLRSVVGRRRDEVGDLADAVDAMAERLAGRLQAEQRFTADVAHDLRTPVTGLVTAAALLDDSRPAQLVRDRAEALASLVEELLEVARLDRGTETAELEHVRLLEVLQRTVGRGIVSGEFPDGQVDVHGEAERNTVQTDPRRLERVLSNLIRNALLHGAPPVVVSLHGREVVVRDHGPGFDEVMLVEGPQRFRHRPHGARGNGLGLVIATGQAAILGASLDFHNDPAGGAKVTLRLPDGETSGQQAPHGA